MTLKSLSLLAFKITGVWWICFMPVAGLYAQTTISQSLQLQPVSADTSYFIGYWVVEKSIQVTVSGEEIPDEEWHYSPADGHLRFNQNIPAEVGATVTFEQLPINLPRRYQTLKPVELDSGFFRDEVSTDSLSARQPPNTFSQTNLKQYGSLNRGIIVGSNQDFSLESGLNFEVSGPLTENINLNASLTDQSIPIQPDGTTQNLREFDRVYIQLQAPNAAVEMGDVDVSLQQSSFAQFNRRLQGATGYLNSEYGDYNGALSVVRGTYHSMQFSGQEGVQGPYRLRGKNGEEFVIVLAGTERVFINGERVKRGAENDYIIDYGLGEVTFTNNILIKDETRIVIEYEYVEQNFNRTLAAAEGQAELLEGKLQVGASVIRQADGNDLLSQRSLSEADIALLEQTGDDLSSAVTGGARIATDEERDQYLLYTETDTTFNGQVYTIYEHRPGGANNDYRVNFSRVEAGEGSYRRVSSSTNGLLYEWVGPGQGNYAPYRQLPAPQKQQMVAFNGNYRVSKGVHIFGEWAVSDFDANRFSALDDDDNTDMAYESGLELRDIQSPLGTFDARLSRRYTGNRFQFFERTRDVEFGRKWNVTETDSTKELLHEAQLSVSPSPQTRITGNIGHLAYGDYSGLRQASGLSFMEKGWPQFSYQQDWVQSENPLVQRRADWFRQQGSVSKTVVAGTIDITPYIAFEHENREERNTEDDSLSVLSQSFYEAGPGIRLRYNDIEMDAGVAYRKQQAVLNNRLAPEAEAVEQHYRISYEPGSRFGTTNEVRLRQKNYTDAFEERGGQNRRGLLIKSVTQYATANNFIDGELFYETNTRRRALMQETYVETGPEIGQYVWDDLNGDGVQQVDEFFPEVSANEGTFIRRFIPSDELFPVIDLHSRLMNTIRPFQIGKGGAAETSPREKEEPWWRGITVRSRIDIIENSTTSDLKDVYLLQLNTFRNDSNTVEGRFFWEKELDVLPGVKRADFRVGVSERRGLNKRSAEAVRTFTNQWFMHSAYNISERVRLLMETRSGVDRSLSSGFGNRNYNIYSWQVEPGVNATLNRSWNAGLKVAYIHKTDRYPAEQVNADLLKIITTHRTYLWNRLQTNIRLELRNTQLAGTSSTYGSYELTEGTGTGTNMLWSVNSSWQIGRILRMSFNYDGRTAENRPAIHTVKLVMSASF